ncbi:hypothetical protein [Nocardia cyriacigeorgica]|uniref:hypothetical protein n=1 Tax=Nocardia cyriacigeorgica TaxID=135487 RepID=UPI001892EBC6|nr:hypothetical protein [Nocardia cyriacigeorgica]MBF6455710.1 hypothetical protein [Nocardia cyriacigeorgica]MBF6477563.1 hypothetical protein [Nocardia cyriacigeorgica]MBF6553548.1 hypothetical protein [Nocardia cyriacigeorgica]
MSDSSVNITGGRVAAGNIGGSGNNGQINGPVDLSAGAETDQLATALAELREELARLRAQLAAAPDSAADVDDVLQDLADPEPDIPAATTRWERLRRRIPEPLQNLDTIQQIVGLLEQVRGLAS